MNNLDLKFLQRFAGDCVHGLLHMFYPQVCGACGAVLDAAEPLFCLTCEAELPETDYHRIAQDFNPAARRFWGRVEVQAVWACWQMKGAGPVRDLLHRLKYRSRPDLARACGAYYAELLKGDDALQHLDGFSFVPMDRGKEGARGYNAAREIARGLSECSGLPLFEGLLSRLPGGRTQTFKDRFERWESVRKLYGPGPELSKATQHQSGLHLALVDDVMTTGATLEICANILTEAGMKVSLLALAAAD